MSYKIGQVLTMLDEVLMRLDNIEKHIGIKKKMQKKSDTPSLTVVTSDNNVIEFHKND